jgi:hypothetical protein
VGSQKLYSFEKQTGISSAKDLKREDIIKASSFLGAEYICASRLEKKNNEYLFIITLYNGEGDKINNVDIKSVKPELFQLSHNASDAVLKMFNAGDSKIKLEEGILRRFGAACKRPADCITATLFKRPQL